MAYHHHPRQHGHHARSHSHHRSRPRPEPRTGSGDQLPSHSSPQEEYYYDDPHDPYDPHDPNIPHDPSRHQQTYQNRDIYQQPPASFPDSKYTSPEHLRAYEGHGYGYGFGDHGEYEDYNPTQIGKTPPPPPPPPPQHQTKSPHLARHTGSQHDDLHIDPPDAYLQQGDFDQSRYTSTADQSRTRSRPVNDPDAPDMRSTYVPTGDEPPYTMYEDDPDSQDHDQMQRTIALALDEIQARRTSSASATTFTSASASSSASGPTPPAHSALPPIVPPKHPRSRPLPGPPSIDTSVASTAPAPVITRKPLTRHEQRQLKQDALFLEVENAVLNSGTPASRSAVPYQPDDNIRSSDPYAHHDSYSHDAALSAGPGLPDFCNQEPYGAGVPEDHQPAQNLHHRTDQSTTTAHSKRHSRKPSASSSHRTSLVRSRTNSCRTESREHDDPVNRPHRNSRGRAFSYDYDAETDIFYPPATVDAGDHGGLVEPDGERRPSFDEGDEYYLSNNATFAVDHRTDQTQTHDLPLRRPLPAPPPYSPIESTSDLHDIPESDPPYPVDPPVRMPFVPPVVAVPRSASMLQTGSSPFTAQPIRSKTDAEERLRRISARMSYGAPSSTLNSTVTSPVPSPLGMDLPSLPSRRFVPAKLNVNDFRRCKEPWALSSICIWLEQMIRPDEFAELKESLVGEALVALFTNKVPTMNIADAEVLSKRVIDDMFVAGKLQRVEEWVKLGPGDMAGVLYQLTGVGCYSPTVHDHLVSGRCYSHHCHRTLRKADLRSRASVKASTDWATFYGLTRKDLDGVLPKEIERQNILHEIVNTEHDFMEQLDILRTLYRDSLANASPAIIAPPRKLQVFLREVFGRVDAIKQANQDHLLAQLKYRQNEQGPWIKGFSDLFRQWIRKAKAAFIGYAAAFPAAIMMMRQEIERNLTFRAFLDEARTNKRSGKLGWDTYLKSPITRLQRYTLLLSTVHKSMKEESEEKIELQTAIGEIKAVTMDCDARVAEMQRKVDLDDWNTKLRLRPEMQKDVELNLDHLGRELIHRGDLQRTGGSRFNWLDCHALLFDHYFVLAKSIQVVDKRTGSKMEQYDVSRLPIPMDLLILDSYDDPAVQKSTYVKGLTSVSTVSTKPSTTLDLARLSRTLTNSPALPSSPVVDSSRTGPSLQHTVSAPTMITTTILADAAKDSEKIVYPFKIKHLGRREPYVLFAPTAASRAEWASKIIEAKTKHAKSLYAQNAEPFKLRVVADSAFGFEYGTSGANETGKKSTVIKGTPIDRAIRDVEAVFEGTMAPNPVCRAKVNCATSFVAPVSGKTMMIVGSDYGVYLSALDNPRGWVKAINIAKVTQIAVLKDFNLLLLISNGALMAHHLDLVCKANTSRASAPPRTPVSGTSTTISHPQAPQPSNTAQKLSGSKDVSFFAAGRMKDNRMLIVYKKRDGTSSSSFKILEPVYARATERKQRLTRPVSTSVPAGSAPTTRRVAPGTMTTTTTNTIRRTDTFREYDDFTIASECTCMNLFQRSIAIGTATRGFEVTNLEKKSTHFSVPDFKTSASSPAAVAGQQVVGNIARHVEGQSTLGMLRLTSEQEFLVVYEGCAVYVNRYGDVSRSVIMNFVGRAKGAAFVCDYGFRGGDQVGAAAAAAAGGGGAYAGIGTGVGLGGTGGASALAGVSRASYLVLFDEDFVEVRNALNGRLRQVIAGRDVKCLDDGLSSGSGRVVFSMRHPEQEGVTVLLEMLLDDTHEGPA